MGNKVMIVLGLVFILVGLELVVEGVKEHKESQGNVLKLKMNSQGYYVVPKEVQ